MCEQYNMNYAVCGVNRVCVNRVCVCVCMCACVNVCMFESFIELICKYFCIDQECALIDYVRILLCYEYIMY